MTIPPTNLLFILTLILMWFILTGISFTIKSILLILLVISFTLCFSNYFKILPRNNILKLAAFKYCGWLIFEIYKSAFAVIKLTWQPKLKQIPSMQWISLAQTNEIGKVIYANSITLTPGTITVDISGDKILVHALDQTSLAELKKNIMGNKVREILC